MAEPAQANEGATKANEGEVTLPMVSLNNNKDNDSQEKQQPNPRLMLLPIDLSSTGLRRSERERKTTQQMNLTATVRHTMCYLARWVDHQERAMKLTDGTLNYPYPLTLTAQAADTETFHYTTTMQQPDREQFILAMIKEIEDLTKAEVWELECCDDIGQQKVIKVIWSFK